MVYENLIYEKQGHVAVITLNRPKALNALNDVLLTELAAAVEAVAADEDIRVAVITGAGKAFEAGADIDYMKDFNSIQAMAYMEQGQSLYRRIEKVRKPFIAAINGFALGGGCELTMACDIRIASTKAKIGLPEVGLGIFPGFGGTQRMPRLIGDALAKELIFTTRQVNGQEAKEIGLVNRVVEPEELMNTALEMANVIACKAPIAVGLAKDAINRGRQVDIDDAMSIEAANDCIAFSTEDQKEGMYAFVEKRPPVFKNR